MGNFIVRLSELTVKFQEIIHSYFSPGFWLALLIIGPILIYRFGKAKRPVNSDKAFPIALIFGLVMYVVLYFLRPESPDNLTKDIMSGILIAAYSIINYFIMISGTIETQSEKNTKATTAKATSKSTQKKVESDTEGADDAAKKTAAKAMKCKRCGAKLPAGSQYCNKCGKRS